MEPKENNNDFGVYVIFTRDIISEDKMVDTLLTHMTSENDLLYCRACTDKENNVLNRFICCIKKDFYQHLVDKCNFKRDEEFNITKYRVNNHPLTNGTTYGFYVKCSEQEREKIMEIFDKFERNNFIRKGSYKINTPNPYPNGDSRGYIIVSFTKIEDKYPRQYIRKLKALLNNSLIGERRIHINWASNSVLRDVVSSASKSQKS